MKQILKALAAPCMALAALFLAACGSSTLEFRNSELVQGKFYRSGANKPFSGKITNVPSHLILVRKEFEVVSKVPAAVLGMAAPGFPHNTMGQVCDVRIDDGIPDGAATCTTDAGKFLSHEMEFDRGVLTGEFKFYFPGTNKPKAVVHIDHGVLDGRTIVYGPESGREVLNVTFKQGKLARTEEIFDDQSGKLVRRTPVEDGAITGEIVEYVKHGTQLAYRAQVQLGLLNGVEERYEFETGLLESRQHWALGQLHGEVVRLKRDPKTERMVNQPYVAARYKNGKAVYVAGPGEEYIPDVERIAEEARQEKIRACVKEQREELARGGREFISDSEIGQLQAQCHHAIKS